MDDVYFGVYNESLCDSCKNKYACCMKGTRRTSCEAYDEDEEEED